MTKRSAFLLRRNLCSFIALFSSGFFTQMQVADFQKRTNILPTLTYYNFMSVKVRLAQCFCFSNLSFLLCNTYKLWNVKLGRTIQANETGSFSRGKNARNVKKQAYLLLHTTLLFSLLGWWWWWYSNSKTSVQRKYQRDYHISILCSASNACKIIVITIIIIIHHLFILHFLRETWNMKSDYDDDVHTSCAKGKTNFIFSFEVSKQLCMNSLQTKEGLGSTRFFTYNNSLSQSKILCDLLGDCKLYINFKPFGCI